MGNVKVSRMNRRQFNKSVMFWATGLGLTVTGCGEKMQKSDSGNIVQAGTRGRNSRRPNILFCLADDASYPHMGAYGCDWVKTPGFDYVAKNGVLFTNTYTPNAKCAPSRACILTGRNSWQLEEAANHMPIYPLKFKTYAEALEEQGYHVGSTGKGWAPGIALHEDGAQRYLCGTPYQKKRLTPPADGISNYDYTANFQDFLARRKTGQPFCFWYGAAEPHRKYEYGCGINKGGKKLSQIKNVFDFWPQDDRIKTDLLDYAYELEYFDKHVRTMMDALEQIGELDNTIVVVTADNGMPFPRIKGQAYEYSNHMPLAVMWKNGIAKPGRTVDDFVSFIDFAPTFLELAGVSPEPSGMQPIQGRSLTDIFYSRRSGRVNPDRDHVLICKERHDVGRPHDGGYPIRGIVKGDYLYIMNFEPNRWPAGNPETGYPNTDGSPTKTVCLDARDRKSTYQYWRWNFGKRPEEELYNIARDRQCIDNLADKAGYAPRKAELKKQLFDELKAQNDPRMFANGAIFDEYKVCWPEYRDFYEKFTAGEKIPTPWINPSDIRPLQK